MLMEVGEEMGPELTSRPKNLDTRQEHRFDFVTVQLFGFLSKLHMCLLVGIHSNPLLEVGFS